MKHPCQWLLKFNISFHSDTPILIKLHVSFTSIKITCRVAQAHASFGIEISIRNSVGDFFNFFECKPIFFPSIMKIFQVYNVIQIRFTTFFNQCSLYLPRCCFVDQKPFTSFLKLQFRRWNDGRPVQAASGYCSAVFPIDVACVFTKFDRAPIIKLHGKYHIYTNNLFK